MEMEEITNKLKPIVNGLDSCGFETYLVSRNEPKLKKLKLSQNDLHGSLKEDISKVIEERYLDEGAKFTGANNIADNQKNYYVIQQTDGYRPFNVTEWAEGEFKEEDLDDFMGFFFYFRYDQQDVWCYQNRRSTTITNRKKTSKLSRLKHYENGWIFEEQNERIVNFAHAIDIIVLDDNIITMDIGLLERSFDFQTFIHQKAQEIADSIAASKLFSGMDKLSEYLASDAKSHKPYRKKILKALDSPVLDMSTENLYSKISTLPRWRGKFKEPVDGMIPIESVKEVEALIDLLIERFTVSQVSGQEYDTEVKTKAKDT